MTDQDNGQQQTSVGCGEYLALDFIIKQALGFVRTGTIVQVQAVYATAAKVPDARRSKNHSVSRT